jgi:hypothetical protein
MSKPLGPKPDVKSPAVYALIRKRADISGEIAAMQVHLRKLLTSLDHIDFTLRIFDSSYALETIRAIPKLRYSFRGQTQKIILDTLRESTRPITASELAIRLIAGRGLAADDPDLRRLFSSRANASLQIMLKRGTVRRVRKVGKRMEWELVRD